jgi:hypothetical protein
MLLPEFSSIFCSLADKYMLLNVPIQIQAQGKISPSLFAPFFFPAHLSPQGNVTSLLSILASLARHKHCSFHNLPLNTGIS